MTINRALPLWAYPKLPLSPTDPMVFITGPRQVGKTHLIKALPQSRYFNWDTVEVKKAYLKDPYFFRSQQPLVCFDEIHKRRDWKKLVKGYYDSPDRRENFIITGSGRFDQLQRGGDSLQGRSLSYQLYPVTYDEFVRGNKHRKILSPRDWNTWTPDSSADSDELLLNLGGFPAPLINGEQRFLRKWQDQYIERLVREDIRDFSAVQRVDQLELLVRLLPERITSPISVKALSEDVECSTVAIRSWLRLLEILFLGFQIKPYHKRLARAVKKEQKWYFHQWTYAQEEGARFENYIAVQLAAACSAWSESGYGTYELTYVRDQDRREVDFLITRDLKPIVLIEAKSSEQAPTSSLKYYSSKLNVPGIIVFPKGTVRRHGDHFWAVPSRLLLKEIIW